MWILGLKGLNLAPRGCESFGQQLVRLTNLGLSN